MDVLSTGFGPSLLNVKNYPCTGVRVNSPPSVIPDLTVVFRVEKPELSLPTLTWHTPFLSYALPP